MKTLFVYGTLLNDEVVHGLTGKVFPSAEAAVQGYRVCSLENKAYPGMVSQERTVAIGRVLYEVDEVSCSIFDAFEGDEYTATTVTAETFTKEKVNCLTYLWDANVLEKNWSNREFRELHLERYLTKVCAEYRAKMQLDTL